MSQILSLTLPKRTPPQKRIQESKARFKIAAWGRQSGKTTNGGWTLVRHPLEGRKNGVYWHILQTHSAAEVAFNRYVRLFPRAVRQILFAKKPNESEKTVFLTGGREVHFKSGQNFDDLRIETLDGAIIDECRQQQKELWSQVVRPMLGRRQGWCHFYSTPNGFDWFYDLAEASKNKPEWETFRSPSWDAWWWTSEEVDSAKATMSEAEFAQEIGAEFRDLTAGKAYVSFGDHNNSSVSPFAANRPWSPYLPVVLGMDFNLSPMSWIFGQTAKDQFHFFDEIYLRNSHTMEAALELRNRILTMRFEGFRAETEVILCGDATGKATQRSSNQSDYDIVKAVLRDAGIKFRDQTPESNPSIKDRVNAVNTKCKNARGEVELWVNFEKCKMLVHDLQRVTWKVGADITLDPGSKKELTHCSDAIGYVISEFCPIKGVREIGKTRILQRTL